MSTLLPVDANDQPMPVLRLRPNGTHTIAASDVSARNAIPFQTDTRVISLYATAPVYVRFGSDTVTATDSDHYVPADTLIDLAIAGDDRQTFSHMAVLRVANDASVYISEKY